MQVKTIEIRDKMTFIPAIAIRLAARDERDRYLLRRCGYGSQQANILLTSMDGGRKACSDPYEWGDRTYAVTHLHLQKHWETVQNGDVIDVEFLLKEVTTPKISEEDEQWP